MAIIYHNPQCSKSRQALQMLQDSGVDTKVIEYMKAPPTASQILDIAKALNVRPSGMIRMNEDKYKELQLDANNDDALVTAMAMNPVLIERPIVITFKGAVIARPPEKIRVVL